MLTVCWSPKGGSGTSVVAAAIALAGASAGRETLLVDLDGDQPALLGLGGDTVAGLNDWLGGGADIPADALAELEMPVTERLTLLPRGTRSRAGADRLSLAMELLATSRREVIVDAGTSRGEPPSLCADRLVIVLRPCYLAARRLVGGPGGNAVQRVLVLVEEAGRALRSEDVIAAVGITTTVRISWDPAVARAVDAGTFVARRPRSLHRLAEMPELYGGPTS